MNLVNLDSSQKRWRWRKKLWWYLICEL